MKIITEDSSPTFTDPRVKRLASELPKAAPESDLVKAARAISPTKAKILFPSRA